MMGTALTDRRKLSSGVLLLTISSRERLSLSVDFFYFESDLAKLMISSSFSTNLLRCSRSFWLPHWMSLC